MTDLFVWTLDMQRYALSCNVVERVLRAVEVTSLPDAPARISGIVNVRGEIVPVVNLRERFRLPQRETLLSDLLVLARSARRTLGFFADTVIGVIDAPEESAVPSEDIVPGMGSVTSVVKLADGLILIQDLDRFLSLDEEDALDNALDNVPDSARVRSRGQ